MAIYSLTGQLVADFSTKDALDISNLEKGTFLIQVTFTDESTQIKRFVKE